MSGVAAAILIIAVAWFFLGQRSLEEWKERQTGALLPVSTAAATSLPSEVGGGQVPAMEYQMQLGHLTVADERLLHSTIAPQYMDEDQIVFSYANHSAPGVPSNIAAVQKKDGAWRELYTVPPGFFISSLVGMNEQLFWIETISKLSTQKEWTMKSLALDSGEVNVLRTGKAEEGVELPVLRADVGLLSWVEQVRDKENLRSTALVFEPLTQSLQELATKELTEERNKERRSGELLLIQRPVQEGLLVQQSVFNQGKKSYELMLYPYDNTEPSLLLESKGIADFTANSQWLVWTTAGKVLVVDRKIGNVVYEVKDFRRDLIFDSPFIWEDTLYYRYAASDIYTMDLKSGNEQRLTGEHSMVSRLFRSDEFLAFAENKEGDLDKEVEFCWLSTVSSE